MRFSKTTTFSNTSLRSRFVLPVFFLLISFVLMILPLERAVASIKVVLAYVFIPQVRAAHTTVQYATGVSDTVQDLLRAHQENIALKKEIETAHLLSMQAQELLTQNERLTQLLALKPSRPWKGVWAQVAYREPTQWNTVTIDKGAQDGIEERSAVISMEGGKEGLAGVVVEVNENTAKVLLVSDENFSAAVRLERGEEGLLVGNGTRAAQVKYIPLLTQVAKGDKVYTSSSSSIFPAGILVGEVSGVHQDESFQTALTVNVTPQVRSSAVKEMFIILDREPVR